MSKSHCHHFLLDLEPLEWEDPLLLPFPLPLKEDPLELVLSEEDPPLPFPLELLLPFDEVDGALDRSSTGLEDGILDKDGILEGA